MMPAPPARPPLHARLAALVRTRGFWTLVALQTILAVIHYATPQIRLLPFFSFEIQRHAVERIVFLMPIAAATFAFGQTGGLVTLVLSVLIMLPRALWISPYIGDSLIEIGAVAIVGSFIVWVIETQEREKRLRQKAVSRLRAIHAVTTIVTESLELEQLLSHTLSKVLEVAGLEVGLIFLLDPVSQELILRAYQGIAPESAAGVDRLKFGEGFCGRAAQSGELMLVEDATQDPRLTRMVVREEGLRAQAIIPLKSKRKVQGVLAVATRQERQFLPEELELLTAIGGEIGVAIENARLYENMRFYIRQINRAQEEERKRIARDLHDDTIQALITLARRLELLLPARGQESTLPEPVVQRIKELYDYVGQVIQNVRRFTQDLRPSVLDDLGLLPAVEGVVAALGTQDGIQVALEVVGERRRLAQETELTLFRIVQETLNNVKKHAQATQVNVTVQFDEVAVRITVQDNGVGFSPPALASDWATTGRLGLAGMDERARLIGGRLEIVSRPGQGTRVMIEAPLDPATLLLNSTPPAAPPRPSPLS